MSLEYDLPETISRSAVEIRGVSGRAWLRRLPSILDECVERWSLALDPPFPNLTINYVAPAIQAGRAHVVLKVCYPDDDYYTEVDALKLFDGQGVARVLEADSRLGVILLERLRPGSPLTTLFDDRLAMSVAAGVMRKTRRPVPPTHAFPSIDSWVERMSERSPRYVNSSSRFPVRWVRHAIVLHNQLVSTSAEPVLLHGDMHHQNILSAEREDWLAIDPRGLIGEPACETTPLLFDALPPKDGVRTRQILARRVDQLAEELGFERERIRAWGIVRAVLSAFRALEEKGRGWEWGLGLAEALLRSGD